MAPLGESTLWPYIRDTASKLIVERMHEMGDYDSGISSSDVNHTVFGVASWVYVNPDTPSGDRSYASAVLRALVDELAGYGS